MYSVTTTQQIKCLYFEHTQKVTNMSSTFDYLDFIEISSK